MERVETLIISSATSMSNCFASGSLRSFAPIAREAGCNLVLDPLLRAVERQ